MKSKYLLCLAAGLLAATTAIAQSVPLRELESQGKKPLDQDALQKLVVGNTLSHRNLVRQQKLDFLYKADGKRVVWLGGTGPGTGRRFEGPYEVRDGQRCEASISGGNVCFTMVAAGDGNYYVCDRFGGCEWLVTVQPGNPLKIE